MVNVKDAKKEKQQEYGTEKKFAQDVLINLCTKKDGQITNNQKVNS
jgi:hypothetical protein